MKDKYIITLDDGYKYLVISKVKYNNSLYCYVGRLDDSSILKYGKIEGDDLVFIDDENIIKTIAPLLIDKFKTSFE